MNEKEKRYWEGVAKAKSEIPPKTKSLEEVLEWQDAAVEFVRKLKGKTLHEEPTEIEFYKKWVALKKKHEGSH